MFLDVKLHSERDVLAAEEQQQHKMMQAQSLNISNMHEAADWQLIVHKQQDALIEKLLGHLKNGKGFKCILFYYWD